MQTVPDAMRVLRFMRPFFPASFPVPWRLPPLSVLSFTPGQSTVILSGGRRPKPKDPLQGLRVKRAGPLRRFALCRGLKKDLSLIHIYSASVMLRLSTTGGTQQ